MAFNQDHTDKAPDHLKDKLHWAGAYNDEDTNGDTHCAAEWEKEASDQDCADMDAYFAEQFGDDMARMSHTGRCPDGRNGQPEWYE
ncbi:MAG: hypothetical protein ACR2RE_03060 [Geminicoccaceae bacterium]